MKIEVPRGPGRILASKHVLGGVWAAIKERNRGQHGVKLAPQTKLKSIKKNDAKSIQKLDAFQERMFLDFHWFWKGNGAKLVPKSCQKSVLTSNGRISQKPK